MRYLGNGYTFKRPFRKDGTPAFYMTVYNLLVVFGPMTKKQMMRSLGRTDRPGYLTAMFTALNHAGLVTYNKTTKKYEPAIMVDPAFARREIL